MAHNQGDVQDRDLTHEQAQALFSERHDGTLAPDGRAALDRHLAGCEACRVEQSSFEDTMKALKTASVSRRLSPPAPDQKQFAERVEREIEGRSDGRFFSRRLIGGRFSLAWVSLLMLILALAVYAIAKRSTTGSLGEPIRRAPNREVPPDDVRRDLPRP